MPATVHPADARLRAVLVGSLAVVVIATGVAGALHAGPSRWSSGNAELLQPTEPADERTREAPELKDAVRSDHPLVGEVLKVLLALVAIAAVVLVVIAVVRWWRSRPRRASAGRLARPADVVAEEADPTPDVARVLRGFDRAFEVLGEDRPPTDAIVAAWLGLEEAAQDAGVVRGASETPTELTARILRLLDVDERASQVLLDLYQRTRFGGRDATAADVETARECLATMTSGWHRRSSASAGARAGGAARPGGAA